MKKNDDNKVIIARKYNIIPTCSEKKEWKKKVYDFTIEDLNKKIIDFEKKIKKQKDKKKKENYIQKLNTYKESLASLSVENPEFTQTMINNYTYNLIRSAMEEEARKKNYILTWIFSEMIANGVQYMPTLQEKNKFVSDTINYARRVKGSSKGSLFDNTEITNTLGAYGLVFTKELKNKIQRDIKDGLLDGKVSLSNYKLDSPCTIAKDHMKFTSDYDTFEELCEHIDDNDLKMYFNYGSKGEPTIAKFKINLGHGKNRAELKSTLLKVYSGEYEYCGSSIQIAKTKIILNLTMKIPKKELDVLNEDTVVGVDLGIKIPAMCALNNDAYSRQAIGSSDDFLVKREQFQKQRERLQKALKNTKGGHGRKKKLQALNRVKNAEAHFVETYNHMVSKRVVDFALKYHAKYINLENLTGYDTSDKILRNWSYYKLQTYITYKAKKYGIIVRKINPCYTSQICSVCGNWHPENRPKGDKGQGYFNCHNEECKSHDKEKYKYGLNADFNAARNIAMSTLWMDEGKVTEKKKEEAREYYGIEEEYQKYLEEKQKNKKKAA
jgi:IS605 OrfB family transposase